MIFLSARSNASPVSSALISRAFPLKRSDCALSSDLRFGLAMGAHLPISRSIGKPPANDTAKGLLCPLGIAHAKRDPLIIPEIILSEIAVKVLLSAMLVDALHAALEDAEIAFDGVGVDRGHVHTHHGRGGQRHAGQTRVQP